MPLPAPARSATCSAVPATPSVVVAAVLTPACTAARVPVVVSAAAVASTTAAVASASAAVASASAAVASASTSASAAVATVTTVTTIAAARSVASVFVVLSGVVLAVRLEARLHKLLLRFVLLQGTGQQP